jgi:hypothetical protein
MAFKTKKLFYFFLTILLFFMSGCLVYQGYQYSKRTSDVSDQIYFPPDKVWSASLAAVDELSIVLDEKEFDGKNGFILGHKQELNYIKIDVELIEPEIVLLGVSARKSVYPWSSAGYDEDFASELLEHIKNIIYDQNS